jgi:hypothetical protein
MTAARGESLWAMLVARGLATGAVPQRDKARAPWFVRVMLGIAGWIGALFLLGFAGVMFASILDRPLGAAVLGALACVGAAVMFRSRPKSDFAEQFGLAVSIAGQGMIVIALGKWFGMKLWPAALLMAGVQTCLFLLAPSFVHRVWVAWTGVFAIALALDDVGLRLLVLPLAMGVFTWVWVREFDFGSRAEMARAGGYGLALFACLQLVFMHGEQLWGLFLFGDVAQFGRAVAWIGAGLSAAVLPLAVVVLLGREGVGLDSRAGQLALASAVIVGVASFKAPGVGSAVAILVIGFANGNRVLSGLGILALLGYLSQFYYALHATLLEKSILLVCSGLALLLARFVLHRWWLSQPTEVTHA